ncbi:uncharacterized protein LOC128179047 isoform X1 [Crassostrea angulata]|uniref:uncharacterized protein LOC128179047 isoform X1 n=1 Tax=Magallana angulata TaxID=2784310 RepID=UPI0022B0B53A|nr:uncharacterized protein LOC128179047 isoform X1 [Crassostrea angulata]
MKMSIDIGARTISHFELFFFILCFKSCLKMRLLLLAITLTKETLVLKASNKYVRYKKVMQSLCPSEVDMYRDAFNFFDKSKKGYLVADDFERALTTINSITETPTSREDAESLVREYDVNGDGKITFEELVVSIVKRKETKDKDSELQKLFQNFDSDGDGALNKGELIALLGSIQEKVSATDIDEILADFDENETGLMQYNGKKFSRLQNTFTIL